MLTFQNGYSAGATTPAALFAGTSTSDAAIDIDIENNIFMNNTDAPNVGSVIVSLSTNGNVAILNNAFTGNALSTGYGIIAQAESG
jgi:hypothetical protein